MYIVIVNEVSVFFVYSECRKGGVVCRDDVRCNYRVNNVRPRQHLIRVSQLDNDEESDVHVMIPATGDRLVGMMTLVNSVWKNTRSSVMFHLITDKQSYEHLQIWLDESELRHIQREIIIFDDEWIRGKVTMRSTRADLAAPVRLNKFARNRYILKVTILVLFAGEFCSVLFASTIS